jgi:hypothetical protein
MVIWFCVESVMNSVTQDPGLPRLRHAVTYRAMKPPISFFLIMCSRYERICT